MGIRPGGLRTLRCNSTGVPHHILIRMSISRHSLCIMLKVKPFLEGRNYFIGTIPSSLIPIGPSWETVCIGDDIYVSGCPSGLHDSVNHSPFLRKGVVASFPRDGRSHFFIDCPTIEGSSGSPVFIDSHVSFNRTLGQYDIGSRFFLVGVVTDGLEQMTDAGRIDLHFGKAARSDTLPLLYKEILNTLGG